MQPPIELKFELDKLVLKEQTFKFEANNKSALDNSPPPLLK